MAIRSAVLSGAVLAACALLLGSAFVAAPHRAPAPASPAMSTAALSAVAMATPTAAFAAEGSEWIPALSAVGAGFAIGLAAIGLAQVLKQCTRVPASSALAIRIKTFGTMAPRSAVMTGAVLLACALLMGSAFVAAPLRAPQAQRATLPTAALSAVAMVTPLAAHAAAEGSEWIPALSAVGAGFAIGLAAIGSGVGQGIAWAAA
eukprot:CAMPEP_0177458292 /NCGR_PEP_ID=MMETSP0369-20130122/13454_1 /TAXON_ID=447022 ORGANISM="Scrippsiella hangoei-like, Strain SHHI-4" /NCGR_SAMPLE_ID=MMETSP0369 /ASSEMBLY_ACC=CAM_ASM_000364 /LENGTH=203 /DNA_ID=CAMNT_0018931403 /DNA_START=57 /DNA_END=665 /DNA_ORIENTATION=-